MSAILRKYWHQIAIIILPLAPLPVLIIYWSSAAARCGYVVLTVGLLWAFQPVHLTVTAFIPMFLLPMLGLMESSRVCEHYLQESNVVFLASLIIAVGIETSDLHRRCALRMLMLIGTEFQWLLLGCMLTTMFLAVWIINTAAAAMMLPILDALCEQLFPIIGSPNTESSPMMTASPVSLPMTPLPSPSPNQTAAHNATSTLSTCIVSEASQDALRNVSSESGSYSSRSQVDGECKDLMCQFKY